MRKYFSRKMLLSFNKLDVNAFWDFDMKYPFWYSVTYIKYTWWGLVSKTITEKQVTRARSWEDVSNGLSKQLNKWIK